MSCQEIVLLIVRPRLLNRNMQAKPKDGFLVFARQPGVVFITEKATPVSLNLSIGTSCNVRHS